MEQEMTIELREIYKIVKKRIWLVVAITLAAAVISAIVSFLIIPPTYEAKVSIIINNKTYTEIAKTRYVAEKTAEKLGDGTTADAVLGSITILPKADTQIYIMKASGRDAEKVKNMVNQHAKTFAEEAPKLQPGGTIKIVDEALLPKTPVNPNPKQNIVMAAFLGIMISLGIIFILEYMDNTLKTEEDVERNIGLPVIGVIPRQIKG